MAAAATELQANNVIELLGRDRRKPYSLQLFISSEGSDKSAVQQFLSLAEDWCAQIRCCWVDCDSEPDWAIFCKRLVHMDATAAANSGEGTGGAEVELVVWRKGGLQCARYTNSDRTVEAWDEWIRGIRSAEVQPQWHTLRSDGDTEVPYWPKFASDADEDDGDDEVETDEDTSEDSS